MRLTLETTGSVAALMQREIAAGERAVTSAVQKAGGGLKEDWRGQVTSAGLGRRLAKSIRSRRFPKDKESINAAALVWTKAPKIIRAFDEGEIIRAKSGSFLAIPTEFAPRKLFYKRTTPSAYIQRYGQGSLQYVRTPGGTEMLVDTNLREKGGRRGGYARRTGRSRSKRVSAPMFWLVRQADLGKRLDLERDVRKWSGRIPRMIVDAWVSDRTGLGDG